MTADLALVFVAGALIACGVTLLLQRSLSRIVIGVLLAGNGVNVLFLAAGGPAGRAPIIGAPDERGNLAPMSDPLPQAMVLTAIVITLGVSAFLLAMAYRSWQTVGHDEVRDDVEDRLQHRLAGLEAEFATDDRDREGTPDEEGADP